MIDITAKTWAPLYRWAIYRTLDFVFDVRSVVVDHLLLVALVHAQEGGGRIVPGAKSDQIILHKRKDLGVEILVAGQHLQGLVHQSINVCQVFHRQVPLAFRLKNGKKMNAAQCSYRHAVEGILYIYVTVGPKC
jgi:hypothetical protein